MSNKIQEFNRANVRALHAEVEAALKPIAEKYGLLLERKGRTFYRDSLPAGFQFVVATEGADGEVLDSKAKDFQRLAGSFGLKAEDLGKEFISGHGERYRITGLNPRAKRYPILGERVSDGKTYKFGAITVKHGLGRING
jgi:hypothetical protein